MNTSSSLATLFCFLSFSPARLANSLTASISGSSSVTGCPKDRVHAICCLELPYKFSSLAFAFYMATIIAFMMCLLLTAINTGVDTRFIQRVLSTYVIAMPVAFACVTLVRPLVLYLVSKTVATKTGD